MTLKIELPAGGATEITTTIEATEQTESTADTTVTGATQEQPAREQISWSLFLKNATQQAIGERLSSEISSKADSANLRTRRP